MLSCCSPALCTALSHSSAPKQPPTTHNRNQSPTISPLKSVSLDTQSVNTCLQRKRQWQMGMLPGSVLSTTRREMTFILGNSSLARPRQCNLNQPLHYHGKSLFDLPSLEMGVQRLYRNRNRTNLLSCSHDFHQGHWGSCF